MESKQHIPKQLIAQGRNQKGSKKKSWDKRKWRHNITISKGYGKNSSKRKIYKCLQ